MFSCRICGNSYGNQSHFVKEMQLGLGEVFEYIECAVCQCLQIKEIPSDLFRYYPDDYYSFKQPDYSHSDSRLASLLKRKRSLYEITGKGIVGKVISGLSPQPAIEWNWFRLTETLPTSTILDVGCGQGQLLSDLYMNGFTNLHGLDPFIKREHLRKRLAIRKGGLTDISNERFDLIMFHHSLEHTPNPLQLLKAAFNQLHPGRFALVRLPVFPSFAWERYKTNWVQLDAPRHLFIPSVKGMEFLAASAGFKITHTIYDSSAFDFYGSDRYEQGIIGNLPEALPTKDELEKYSKLAEEMNAQGKGSSAAFYLYKPLEIETNYRDLFAEACGVSKH